MKNNVLDNGGFLRVWQVVGDKKKGVTAIIPVSNSQWWLGVKSGKYPQPIKLGERMTVWRADDIKALIEKGVS